MQKKPFFLFVSLLFLLSVLGCTQEMTEMDLPGAERALEVVEKNLPDLPAVKLIKDEGVIQYIPLEGGFYGIVGSRRNYDPINLPKAFMQDGLKVKFTATIATGMASFHQWGTLIELKSMKSRNIKPQLIMDQGKVENYTIQGNPWVIAGTTGSYQVLNLPEKLKVAGIKVAFVAVIRTDIIMIPPLWPLIDVLEIKQIGATYQTVRLNQLFKLQVKNSALEPRSGILLTFKEVLSDSRCPIGVECFWEGEAVILVNIQIHGRDYGDYKLSTLTPDTISLGAYFVRFDDLRPYPNIKVRIDPSGYTGEFLIGSYPESEEGSL